MGRLGCQASGWRIILRIGTFFTKPKCSENWQPGKSVQLGSMNRRSPTFCFLLASCLIVQGLLAWVLPLQAGMVLAAEQASMDPPALLESAKPPCHSMGHPAPAPVEQPAPHADDGECCEEAVSYCSSLCYWACAFSSGPPAATLAMTPPTPTSAHRPVRSGLPPWVAPIPTPPPIASRALLA